MSSKERQPGRCIVLIGLLLLLVACGSQMNPFSNISPDQATATSVAADATITANEAAATATAKANAVAATATATVAATPNPYPPHTGNLVLNDSLDDFLNGSFNPYGWDERSDPVSACEFTTPHFGSGGAYQDRQSRKGFINTCFATNTNFSNFAYQVQMTIVEGDEGGIVFCGDSENGTFYYFSFRSDGPYFLLLYQGYKSTDIKTLEEGTNPVIHTGLNQHNLIAVVVHNGNIDLYLNMQHVASVKDSTYSSGQIGVAADDASANQTVVEFSNAKVWAPL